MVTVYSIDCSHMTSREVLHDYLKQTLRLPDYYGKNLDALFDCLTELGHPTRLEFSHLEHLVPLGDYGESLMSTFRDAALENANLELIYSNF